MSTESQLVLLVIALVSSPVSAHPNGAPVTSCDTMFPKHKHTAQTESCPFETVPSQVCKLLLCWFWHFDVSNWFCLLRPRSLQVAVSMSLYRLHPQQMKNLKVNFEQKINFFWNSTILECLQAIWLWLLTRATLSWLLAHLRQTVTLTPLIVMDGHR